MYNTLGKTQKRFYKNKPQKNIIPKNCVAIFPIELVSGITKVCNQGILPPNKYYDKGSFLYYQDVLDGRSAIKIQWQDSIFLTKPEGQNYYLAQPQIGQWYYGKPISMGEESLEISEDESFEDFMSLKTNQTITLYFEYTPTDRQQSKEDIESFFRFKLVDNDIYNLYQIPELCEQKLMFIQSHNEVYDDLTGKSKGAQITFASLGDKIQKSGKAIEQYCSWNAPGEFAVIPKIVKTYDEDGNETRNITYDNQAYSYPTPVKYLQVEQQGPALTSTFYALGRRQEWDEEQRCWRIGPSKFLFPCQFITTQPNPLNRTSTPTKNFFFFDDEQVSFTTTAKFWELVTNTSQQPLEKMKNGGLITLGEESSWTEAKNGLHKSNPLQNATESDSGNWHDYYSDIWYPTSWREDNQKSFNTTGCVYSADTMSYTRTDTMIDIMCKNAFIFNQQPIIPLSMSATRPYYLRDIPVIGSIANFFKLGDFILDNKTTNRKTSHLAYFGDASIMGMCANLQAGITEKPHPWSNGTVAFPINFFGNNESQFQKLGVNSANTTFCCQLTDQVMIDSTVYDTIYLGQTKKEDGTYIFENHNPLLANSTIKPVIPTTSNFIIDMVVVQSIFDGKIKISCYGEPETQFIYPLWTATILSNAAWQNGNIRDWTNLFPLSNWDERYCVQLDKFTWPDAPYKPVEDNYVIQVKQGYQYTIDNLSKPTQNNWWQDEYDAWGPFLIYEKEGIGKTLQGFTRITTLYTADIAYTDLGIEGITDKDTFISHFQNAEFDVSKCFITLKHSSDLKQNDRTLNNVKKPSIEFKTGVYEYEFRNYVVSIRQVGDEVMPENNYDDSKLGTGGDKLFWGQCSDKTNARAQAHFGIELRYGIILNENGIHIYSHGMDTAWIKPDYEPISGQNFRNFFNHGIFGNRSENFTSNMWLETITFKKR